jgi:hypothetical protein
MLFTTVYQFPKTPTTCEEVPTSFFWLVSGSKFWVLCWSAAAGCVMFGITGTGLGGTTRLFAAAGTPDLDLGGETTLLVVDVELGTRSHSISRQISRY